MLNKLKFLTISILFAPLFVSSSFAQTETNPTFFLQTVEIPPEDFNKVARDTTIFDLEEQHAVNWQITIFNDLIYANPDGNAVLRFYDSEIAEKFIEIGMGSSPDEKFWIAVNIPGKSEYVVMHSTLENGWAPGTFPILAFKQGAGLTVNNGDRIVVANLDIGNFAIGSYSAHGMENSRDPPAVNSGQLSFEILSGDPSENMFYLFPFFLLAAIGGLVGALLITKKRK